MFFKKIILQSVCFINLMLLSVPAKTEAQWVKNQLDNMAKLQNSEPKLSVVFLYADWCQYCKTMENTVFKNPKIAELINTDFYFFELNIEEQKPIQFHEKKYNFQPNGYKTGTHQLAEYFVNDAKITVPTLIILDAADKKIFQYDGFISHMEMTQLLLYFSKTSQ